MLWMLVGLLLLFWLFGAFVANLGAIIHILLVLAAIVFVYSLLVGRRRAV